MTQLIIALDTKPQPGIRHPVNLLSELSDAGVRFFKVSVRNMLAWDTWHTILKVARIRNCDLMFDLKVYDTRDTVKEISRLAFDEGTRFLTVHATPSMLEAAMRAKLGGGDYCKVLAVSCLTDATGMEVVPTSDLADGIVCSVHNAHHIRSDNFRYFDPHTNHIPGRYPGIVVCPGIRRAEMVDRPDNHINPASPSEARAAGANYIVVGRPIIDAPDPVAAARAIMEELG